MIDETSLNIIRLSAERLVKPVRLVVFTKDRDSSLSMQACELSQVIKAQSDKVALESYDVVMDRDKTEQYGIQRAPAVVVEGGDGQAIVFYGSIKYRFLEVIMHTIQAISVTGPWLPAGVLQSLQRLHEDVRIRVFAKNDCPRCRSVAEIAIGLALACDRIKVSIIMVEDFPELTKKYNISIFPKIIFGENHQADGTLSESEFLERVFQAKGELPGMDKYCLVCGAPSSDIICKACKTRIQAEALDHKLKIERQKQPDIP